MEDPVVALFERAAWIAQIFPAWTTFCTDRSIVLQGRAGVHYQCADCFDRPCQ